MKINSKNKLMKTFKILLAIILVSVIAISCKSDKKNTQDTTEVEAVEIDDEVTSEESGDKAIDDASQETTKAEAKSQQISVVYPKDKDLAGEVSDAIQSLIKDNPSLKTHFNSAYGYVIFPKITKAGLGIGGAGGKGLVFEKNNVIGLAKIAQATFGLQAGGQQYSEVIFFENKEALDKFRSGKLKFAGQASAVALKEGTSVDIDYQDGVSVFTKAGGGIMAEASVGGQKFTYKEGVN